MATQAEYAVYPGLKDRVVVISGGASGIGESMVELFTMQGSQVVFLDIDTLAATKLVERLGHANPPHIPIFYECNVIDIEKRLKPVALSILSRFPRIHGLINNAAHDRRLATQSITVEQWDEGVAVNLRHQFFLTQALIPGLSAAGNSSVINMGSIVWAIPAVEMAPYVASKAAIVGLTRTLAHELGVHGIRVNSIMPGQVFTERQARDVITPEGRKLVLERQALKRELQPDEISRVALWLIADDSSGITSQNIVVDGGWI
jgi:NAD(P)-dependent dehydrogenase (short-subunit alcohol dehydrogenase family)